MNGIFRFGLTVAAMFAALYPVSALAAQADYYLKLDTIEGDSKVKDQGRGWIEIQGWDSGNNNSVSICREAASGQASGRRQYAPIIIRKRIDKSTPLLAKALVNNETIGNALFLAKQANGVYLKYELKEVFISGIAPAGGGAGGAASGGAASETVTLKFVRCELK
jgi:type VI secretion system Hcp family effector